MSSEPIEAPERVGRLENGWGRLAIDLSRAMLAELGGYKGVVLGAVLERSWWAPWLAKRADEPTPDPIPIKLNLSNLAEQTGLSRQTLTEAKRQLIHSGMLLELDDGSLLPQKDFATRWRGANLFIDKGRMRDFCREGSALIDEARADRIRPRPPLKVSGFPDKLTSDMSGKPDTLLNNLSGKPDYISHDMSGNPDYLLNKVSGKPDKLTADMSGNPDTNCQEILTPPPISLKRESREEINTIPRVGAQEKTSQPAPPLPDPINGPLEVFPGRCDPDPAEVEQTWRLLWSAYGDLKLCHEYFERQRWHSSLAWQSAIREALRRKPVLHGIGYIEKIASSNPNGRGTPQPSSGALDPPSRSSEPIPKRPPLSESQRRRYAQLPGSRMIPSGEPVNPSTPIGQLMAILERSRQEPHP